MVRLGLFAVSFVLFLSVFSTHSMADDVGGTFRDYDLEGANQAERSISQQVQRDTELVRNIDTALQSSRSILERINADLAQLRNDYATIDQRIAEQAALIRQKQGEIQRVQDEINRIQANIPNLESQRNQALNQANQLRNQIPSKQQELANARQNVANLQSQLAQKRQEFDQANQSVIQAEQRVNQIAGEFSQADSRANAVKSEIIEIQNRLAQIQNDITNANNQALQLRQQVQQLEQMIETNAQQITATQNDLEIARKNGNKEKVAALEAQLQQLTIQQRQLNQRVGIARQRLADVEAQITAMRNLIPQLQGQLSAKQEEYQKLLTYRENLQAQLNAARNHLNQERARVAPLLAIVQKYEQAVASAQQSVQNIASEIESIQSQIAALENQARDIGQRIENHRREIANLQQRVPALQQEIVQIQQRMQQIQASKPQLERQIAEKESQANQTRARIDQQTRELQVANDNLRQSRERLRQAQVWTQYVQDNIERARQIANRTGERHGSEDGYREGMELGREKGESEGRRIGQQEGFAVGTQEGKRRSYDDGFEDGKVKGWERGLQRANTDANTNGKRDGTSEGKAEGLRKAFNDGLAEGRAAANDPVAFAQGKTEGTAQGLERAKREAAPHEAQAYQKKEEEYRAKPLRDVTTEKNLAGNFLGLQEAKRVNNRYYNPRPPQYPHPVIRDFYIQSYDHQYRVTLDQTYRSEYDRQYRYYYDLSYNEAFERAVRMDYHQERERGYSEAFTRFDAQAYSEVYPGEYQRIKQFYFSQAFEQFKADPTEKQRGFKEGNRDASYQKGLAEGQKLGYENNIAKEIAAAKARGEQKANDKYTKEAVLDFVSASLTDSNADGMYTPGEAVLVSLIVKNFGLVSKTGLKANSRLTVNGKSIVSEVQIPSIGGQTRTTVTVAGRIVSDRDLPDGASGSIKFTVLDGATSVFGSDLALQFRYPLEMKLALEPKSIAPGSSVKTELIFKNRTSAQKNLKLVSSTSSSLLAVSMASDLVVAAGKEVRVPVEIKASASAFFESESAVISSLDGNLPGAQQKELKTVLGAPHKVNAQASGILIGADLSVSGVRSLASSRKLDTFDLRVDGTTVTPVVLKNYTGKIVHLVGSSELRQMSAASLTAILDHAKQGGMVLAWNVSAELPTEILSALGVVRSSQTVVKGISGKNILSGFEVNEISVNGSELALSKLASPSLVSDLGSVIGGAITGNPLADVNGRILTLGLDGDSLQTVALDDLLARLQTAAKSYKDKLAFADKDASGIPAVVLDLRAEIVGDDLDKTVTWFDSKRKDTKLYRAIKTLLKNKDRRESFSLHYPELQLEVNRMTDTKDKASAQKVLDENAGAFSSDLKGYFCKFHKDKDTNGFCK